MRKMMRAALLVLTLSCPAYAGYIPNNVADGNMPTPAPAASGAARQEAAGGHIPNNGPAEVTLAEAVLGLLRSLLSLP